MAATDTQGTTATEPVAAKTNIGEFVLATGERGPRYRAYAEPGSGTVSLRRVYPDPEAGQRVVATGLDSAKPTFTFPSNWSQDYVDKATVAVTNLWRRASR
jgi:hypothetical protein